MATRLQLLIDGDASGARRALDDVAVGVEGAQSKLQKFNGAMSKATVPAAATVASLAAVGKASFDSASALEQSAGAVESVFGTYAGQVEAQAQQAAQNVGLAESQYNDLAAVLGAQLGNMGVSQDQLASQTDNLVGLGADLAATFGGDTSEAVAALSSLMRGERDPIERYGVSIKAADVEAKKAAMGLAGLEGEADAAATTQATLALVMDQTAGAQGAFAREAETAAGQQQRANAEFENAKAALGAGLLPVVSQAAGVLQTFAQWVQENSTLVGVLAVVIGTLAAGVLLYNGITAALPAIQAVATAAQWAWNAAMSANPIGLIILAIAALEPHRAKASLGVGVRRKHAAHDGAGFPVNHRHVDTQGIAFLGALAGRLHKSAPFSVAFRRAIRAPNSTSSGIFTTFPESSPAITAPRSASSRLTGAGR